MKYRVDYIMHIELEAKDLAEARVLAAKAVTAFDLTSDIDAVIGCGDVGDAHAWVHHAPLTITYVAGEVTEEIMQQTAMSQLRDRDRG